MQELFNVALPAGFRKPDTQEEILHTLEALLGPPSRANLSLTAALQYENKPRFGPSAITNLRFKLIDFDLQKLSGRLKVNYDMQLTFGCEDLVKDHVNQHSYYNFVIDVNRKVILFSSDVPEGPSPSDEF